MFKVLGVDHIGIAVSDLKEVGSFWGDILGLPFVNNPDLASDPFVSMQIAVEFYNENKVWAAIDADPTGKTARKITNGGLIGYDHVNDIRARLLKVIV